MKFKENQASAVSGTFTPSSSLAPSASKTMTIPRMDTPDTSCPGKNMPSSTLKSGRTHQTWDRLSKSQQTPLPRQNRESERKDGKSPRIDKTSWKHVELTLVTILKGVINTAYYTGGATMGATVFGPLTAPQNISRIQLNYIKIRDRGD